VINPASCIRMAAAGLVAAALGACTLSQGPPAVSPTKVLSMSSAPVKGADAHFAFAPITGVPAELLRPLTAALNKHAAVRHLSIVPAGDPKATFVVKGYLSAIGDSRSTLLVYVWDVFDANGARLRRVSGQEVGEGANTDPWTGISRESIEIAARATVDELAAWVD
jgi:hypothetical protein